MADMYSGPVVFVNGIHYGSKVIDQDDEGSDRTGADLDVPLTWSEEAQGFIARKTDDPLHNDVHGTRSLLEIIPGSED